MKHFFKIILLIFTLFCVNYAYALEETLILLDASASMLEDFQGSPKYITAINKTKDILSTLPSNKAIGLRIIGISIDKAMYYLTNTDNFCKATSLLEPINTNNLENINFKLDLVFPLGTTPLKYSLEQAINNDFLLNSYKHIILITDGGESCEGDPCNYIQTLMKNRNDIKIDIIAIGVEDDIFKELECLSINTSGRITNVKTPYDFSYTLGQFLMPSTIPETTTKFVSVDENQTKQPGIIKYKNYLLEE